MFDLLTNILVWIVAIPILINLFNIIPKEWFRYIGLFIFGVVLIIGFVNLRFVDQPVPKLVIDLFTFPFTVTGIILLLLFFNLLRLKNPKSYVRSGKEVDNKNALVKLEKVSLEILIAFIIFAIASNNAFSTLFISYLEQQGDNAMEQSQRRQVVNLTEQDLADIKRNVFEVIVVLADNTPYEPSLLEAARVWQNAIRKPIILVSGGKETGLPAGYPCAIAPENPPFRTREMVRDEIATRTGVANIGLRYDARYDPYFSDRKVPTEPLNKVTMTDADDMCAFLTRLPNAIPRSSIIIEASGLTIRSSGEEIKKLEEKKIIGVDPKTHAKILLLATPLEGSRTFLSFRNQGLNVTLRTIYPTETARRNADDRPWPLKPSIRIKPEFFLFSAESYLRSERAWNEFKQLVVYTLRFWMQPPVTDQPPYLPTPGK
ncbi:hypothetical protein TUMEXPCC7403_17910 [Tumidithrix helvetica PCC 7403]|uniref:hypothetical protein n=1 Tax=Tumidithrix helvetica TaxID=3457545 RepID=UPI003CA4425A